jgi:hypothetical protein
MLGIGNTLMMRFENIQTSTSSVEPYPETRIQDQPILVMAFIATAKLEYSIYATIGYKQV